MCAAREQREGGKPSPGHHGRSMLSYSSTTEPNEHIYGRFCTHFAAAWLVPMSASSATEITRTPRRSIGSLFSFHGTFYWRQTKLSLSHKQLKNLCSGGHSFPARSGASWDVGVVGGCYSCCRIAAIQKRALVLHRSCQKSLSESNRNCCTARVAAL